MNNIKRYKTADKTIKFYKTHFGFNEPIKLMIDGTFCLAALKNKINIAEQMPNYLQCQTKLCTSKCVVRELTIFGSCMYGALLVAKQFSLVKCGHSKSTTAMECLADLAQNEQYKYIMCTQDRGLATSLRDIPGCPVVYIKYNALLIEKPSGATRKSINDHNKSQLIGYEDQRKIKSLKKEENIKEVRQPDLLSKILKKRVKGPNPLSCKKKKKNKEKPADNNSSGSTIKKREIKNKANVESNAS